MVLDGMILGDTGQSSVREMHKLCIISEQPLQAQDCDLTYRKNVIKLLDPTVHLNRKLGFCKCFSPPFQLFYVFSA